MNKVWVGVGSGVGSGIGYPDLKVRISKVPFSNLKSLLEDYVSLGSILMQKKFSHYAIVVSKFWRHVQAP
jgi:hypothetical protein